MFFNEVEIDFIDDHAEEIEGATVETLPEILNKLLDSDPKIKQSFVVKLGFFIAYLLAKEKGFKKYIARTIGTTFNKKVYFRFNSESDYVFNLCSVYLPSKADGAEMEEALVKELMDVDRSGHYRPQIINAVYKSEWVE